MATRRSKDDSPRRPPATTTEDRESQMVAASIDLAEKQIREGTASSQVLTHYLKLGSTRERLEQDRLRQENRLLIQKVKSLESATGQEALIKEALAAMRGYQGLEIETFDD